MRRILPCLLLAVYLMLSVGAAAAQENPRSAGGAETADEASSHEASFHEAGSMETQKRLSFQRTFAKGNLTTKIRLLQEAAAMEDRFPALALQGLDFISANSPYLKHDPLFNETALLVVRLAGLSRAAEAAPPLWTLFRELQEPAVRVEILKALGSIEGGDGGFVETLSTWLDEQNARYRRGEEVMLPVIAEAVTQLAETGAPAAFRSLFTAGTLQYSSEISARVTRGLGNLGEQYAELLVQLIREGRGSEKLTALKRAFEHDRFSYEERGRIVETALEVGLNGQSLSPMERQALRDLRYEAALQLKQLEWPVEASLLTEHFLKARREYEDGVIQRLRLIDAINLLGISRSTEAAEHLALYLEVSNTRKENGEEVDEQIILAVVQSLGALGDRIAFDYLLYTGYLDYSQAVKQAARQALSSLQAGSVPGS